MPQPFLVGGEWRQSEHILAIHFPYDGSIVDRVCLAGPEDVQNAIAAAQRGFAETRRLPAYRRSEILESLRELVAERTDDFVELMILESGKNHQTAAAETARALQTLKIAAEEARRLPGEMLSLDWTAAGAGRRGLTRRAPIGTVAAIAPFNYPLNLACHKIGPAIACGNAFILKPSERTPLSSVLLAELILEAGYPPLAFSMLNCLGDVAEALVRDDRVAMLSFTGSAAVGWMLKSIAGRKKVALELGGNAGLIVHGDADLTSAQSQACVGAFANAGQNCISVQRILIQYTVYEAFTDGFLQQVSALRCGDPRDPETAVGPLIHERDAARAEAWVEAALHEGATRLLGGERQGTFFPPTVLAETTPKMRVNCDEVFAPIVTLAPYRDFPEAIERINDSEYGLQAGLFTQDIDRIFAAWEEIDVGGLVINGVPTFRVDHMPYGGIKASGFGREGLRYAIEEMTELRLLVLG
ncbi:MAG: aldehyde dehydrogenase family protein [Chloroflexi bacterium]|nr:aldehyde dehydrogenase family protein [Chloroflexota bacterium]